jgi:hypothetical protein
MAGVPSWADMMDYCVPNTTFSHDPFPLPVPVEETLQTPSVPSTGQTQLTPETTENEKAGTSSSEATNQLAAIITGLEGTNHRLASLSAYHTSKDHIQEWAEELRKSIDLSNALESLLTHTQSLSTLYTAVSELMNPASRPAGHEDCQIPTANSSAVEHYSLLNLLLACHLKLLDSLDTILTHAHTCSRAVSSLPKDRSPRFDIPEIRIGSFVAPPGAAASLFTTMLYQLLLDLQDKNKDLSSYLASNPQQDEQRSLRELQVLSLQSDIIKDRTAGAVEDMRIVKARMLDMGIMV